VGFATQVASERALLATFDQICQSLRDVRQNPEWRFVIEGPEWRGRRSREVV